MKKLLIGIIFFLIANFLFGQSAIAPTVLVSFDDCANPSETADFQNNIISSTINCDCGAVNDCIVFDDSTDTVFLDKKMAQLLNEDFTLSLYFWAEEQSTSYSILSVQDSCSRDSALVIQYIPLAKEIDIIISQSIGVDIRFSVPLNEDRCWHHLVFSKKDQDYSLFLDEEFISTKNLGRAFVIGKNHDFRIGSGPCLDFGESVMRGKIDELRIYNKALDPGELEKINLFPDQISISDTTIFEGNPVNILTGNICSSDFAWFPTSNLTETNTLMPISTTDENITYFLNIDYGSCRVQDSINIFVIDEADIDCENLLLPNVFTPNGDQLNDDFGISNSFIIESINSYEIFDRWGAKIFESANKEDTWDGVFGGVASPSAMYVYKVEYTCLGNDYKKIGSFSLMR